MPGSAENYFDRFLRWIQLDSAAEAEQIAARRALRSREAAEQSGDTLLDLAIEDHRPGLGGRHLFTFVKRNRTLNLPWNRLRIGSPVLVTAVDVDDQGSRPGVVSSRSMRSIQVAVDHWMFGSRFDLDLSADEVTRNRERAALQGVREARGRVAELRRLVLADLDENQHRRPVPRFRPPAPSANEALAANAWLNASQREAIAFALSAEDLAILHGPPGTGKTTSVAAFIDCAVERGESVLACAPSNTAVDNLVERLARAGRRVVRLGHPARVKDDLREHTLDAQVEKHPNMQWVKQLARSAEALYQKAERYTRARPARGAKQDMRREAREYKAEARELERQAVRETLDGAEVICSTTTLDEELLGDRRFNWVVIDEACQSTEPGCWIPLQRGERFLLAGDHCQLPPTVVSDEAAHEGYARSMMQRLVETYGNSVTRRLEVQYRMHDAIMQFSSHQFYDGSLRADASVVTRLLADLENVAASPLTETPLSFIDTAGADFDEEQEPDGASRLNPSEGRIVLRKVGELLASGVKGSEIAVIAPYAAQVRWLRQQTSERDLEIDTVDGFQGREKEAVVISLVRSNREGEIGFLADTRRMNVALTRARRKLIVIGDSSTLAGHPFYKALLEYFESHGAYGTVWEEEGMWQ